VYFLNDLHDQSGCPLSSSWYLEPLHEPRPIYSELLDAEEMNDHDAPTLTGASEGPFEWACLACAFIKS
jgi:hypothetical protein